VNTRDVVLGLGALALVAGCGSSSSSGGAAASPSAVTVSSPAPTPTHTHHHHASASASASPTASPAPTVTVTAAAPVQRCFSIHLALTLGISQGTAGTSYQAIVFTNTGATPCRLFGYPGVSFDDASGAIIGKPASEDAGKKIHVTLAVGGQANALLRQPDPGNFSPSACHQKTADKLRVYPPGETVPLFVQDAAQVCSTSAGRTGVRPVAAGNGG
jgi:hypothetical protein